MTKSQRQTDNARKMERDVNGCCQLVVRQLRRLSGRYFAPNTELQLTSSDLDAAVSNEDSCVSVLSGVGQLTRKRNTRKREMTARREARKHDCTNNRGSTPRLTSAGRRKTRKREIANSSSQLTARRTRKRSAEDARNHEKTKRRRSEADGFRRLTRSLTLNTPDYR